MNNNLVFVTGGTGFLGAHLVYRLLKMGKSVRVFKRKGSSLALLKTVIAQYEGQGSSLFEDIEFADGDLLDVLSVVDAMESAQEVYHCGAIVSFEPRHRKEMMKINIDGTANVVNAALKTGVSRLCYVSSIAALGRGKDKETITEDTHWKTSSYNSHYAISKYGGEREVWRGVEEGLEAVIVNPSIIFGLGSAEGGTARLFHSVWKGLHIYPKGINGFVDVRDVCRAMILLMESDIRNKRFILSATNMSYRDLFSSMAAELGKKKPVFPANRALTSLAWRVEYLRSSVFGSKPLITRETAITSSQEYIYSGDRITKTIDFQYTPFEDTIHFLAAAFRKEWTK